MITATISTGDATTLKTLTDDNSNNVYTATITDSSVSVSDINTINAITDGTLTINSTTVTGSYSELNTLYSSKAGTAGLANEAFTVSGTITVTEANALDDHTTGAITATISDNDASTLIGLSNDNSNNVLTISLTDATVDAANLNTINAITAGTFTVNSTTVNGAAGAVGSLVGQIAKIKGELSNYVNFYLVNNFFRH